MSRCKMKLDSPISFLQPLLNIRMIMNRKIINDDMKFLFWICLLYLIQKINKLLMPMPIIALTQNIPFMDSKSGYKGFGSIPDIVKTQFSLDSQVSSVCLDIFFPKLAFQFFRRQREQPHFLEAPCIDQ